MTTTELNNLLNEYATEDINFAKESGKHAICGTKKGLIEIESLGGDLFQVWNNTAELLTGVMNFNRMVKYISQQYVVEL